MIQSHHQDQGSPVLPITSIKSEEDSSQFEQFEQSLRPRVLTEYIGQEEIKKNIRISLEASKKRNEPFEHILFYGPPGLGKTTLANILASEMQVSIRTTSGPALEKQGDLASILSNLQERDILFIDEIHRLRPAVEEVLYSAMEDFALDLMLGKGPSARSMRLSLPRFTLIGATTKMSLLSSPLRDRFGHVMKLSFYSLSEIQQILLRSAQILNCHITEKAAYLLAKSSRQTPRIANRLLRRVRDYCDVHEISVPDERGVNIVLESLGVDEHGLDAQDRALLRSIVEKFQGGPVGLNTLSASLSEEEDTIENVYEPYLLQLGFLDRTPRGRIATPHAYQYLGISLPPTLL